MNYKDSATLKPDQLPTPEVLRETAARIVPPPAPRPSYVPKAPQRFPRSISLGSRMYCGRPLPVSRTRLRH
jgi:hypothetical protein